MTGRIAKLVLVYLLLGLAATLALVCAASFCDGFHPTYEAAERPLRATNATEPPWSRVVERCQGLASVHLETWLDPVWASPHHEGVTAHTPESLAGILHSALIGEESLPESFLMMDQQSKQLVARGWPWPALWHEYAYARDRDPANLDPAQFSTWPAVEAWTTPGGIRLGSSSLAFGVRARWMPRAIPFRPVWPGLLGDTLLFAAVFGTFHQLAAAARSSRRRRRSQCPACAYDLTGIIGPCPECGKEHVA